MLVYVFSWITDFKNPCLKRSSKQSCFHKSCYASKYLKQFHEVQASGGLNFLSTVFLVVIQIWHLPYALMRRLQF